MYQLFILFTVAPTVGFLLGFAYVLAICHLRQSSSTAKSPESASPDLE
jgi:hypothetical protein